MTAALFVFDLVLLVLASMRLARFFVTDSLGHRILDKIGLRNKPFGRELFSCLFCWGFWAGVIWLALLVIAGGPGYASAWWRYLAGAFALSEIVAHAGLRLGDGGYADDDEPDDGENVPFAVSGGVSPDVQ